MNNQKFNRIWAAYFSPTGNTKKIVTQIATTLSKKLDATLCRHNFTLPKSRHQYPEFADDDLVIFGTPVYAGRVPNLFLPYIASIPGNSAFAVPVVTYGARAFDDALIELRDTLENNKFRTIAGAALVGEHAFSRTLGAKRPNKFDMSEVDEFTENLYNKIISKNILAENIENHQAVKVDGEFPYRTHMRPKNAAGEFIKFLTIKPITDEKCTDCKICAKVCPTGAIPLDAVTTCTGKCIKCNACVKKCPEDAKHFVDVDYIFHKEELEELYTYAPREPKFFL